MNTPIYQAPIDHVWNGGAIGDMLSICLLKGDIYTGWVYHTNLDKVHTGARTEQEIVATGPTRHQRILIATSYQP